MKPYGIAHFDRRIIACGTDKFLPVRRAAKKSQRRPVAANDEECRHCGSIQPRCACDVQEEREELMLCQCPYCYPEWDTADEERSRFLITVADFLKAG
jgi:hypothetical protein